jgi:hypothetical protein
LRNAALWFQWDAPAINRTETQGGQKVAIAELFGWPYADIEKECVFLGKAGWGGVRIWPPSESVFSDFWAQTGERKCVVLQLFPFGKAKDLTGG